MFHPTKSLKGLHIVVCYLMCCFYFCYERKLKKNLVVNKSTNINKSNNHLSPYLTEHKIKTMENGVGNLVPGLEVGT